MWRLWWGTLSVQQGRLVPSASGDGVLMMNSTSSSQVEKFARVHASQRSMTRPTRSEDP